MDTRKSLKGYFFLSTDKEIPCDSLLNAERKSKNIYDPTYDKFILTYCPTQIQKDINQNIKHSLSNLQSRISCNLQFFNFYFSVFCEFSTVK